MHEWSQSVARNMQCKPLHALVPPSRRLYQCMHRVPGCYNGKHKYLEASFNYSWSVRYLSPTPLIMWQLHCCLKILLVIVSVLPAGEHCKIAEPLISTSSFIWVDNIRAISYSCIFEIHTLRFNFLVQTSEAIPFPTLMLYIYRGQLEGKRLL